LDLLHLIHSHSSGLQVIQLHRYSTHFQFTVAHAVGFSVFTSRILATDLSHSHCNFKSHVKSSLPRLIPFLPLFCSCQLRRLDSTRLDYGSILSRLPTVPSYNTSARTPRKTPSSIFKNAALLVRYGAMDALLSRALVLRECVYRPVVQQWVYTSHYFNKSIYDWFYNRKTGLRRRQRRQKPTNNLSD
jgi:hypothetical protein